MLRTLEAPTPIEKCLGFLLLEVWCLPGATSCGRPAEMWEHVTPFPWLSLSSPCNAREQHHQGGGCAFCDVFWPYPRGRSRADSWRNLSIGLMWVPAVSVKMGSIPLCVYAQHLRTNGERWAWAHGWVPGPPELAFWLQTHLCSEDWVRELHEWRQWLTGLLCKVVGPQEHHRPGALCSCLNPLPRN